MNRSARLLSTLVLLALTTASPGRAASPRAGTTLPDTALGRRAAAYFAAFGAGSDEAMRAFFTEHLSAEALQRRPAEERLGMTRRIRADLGTLTPHEVLSESPTRLEVLVQAAGDRWLSFDFEAEPAEPHRLLGIRITPAPSPQERAAAPKSVAELAPALDHWLAAATAADQFAGSVLVTRAGATLYQKAFGLASREYGVPNTVETRFNLGSINKLMTRAAIAQLVEKGLLSPGDTVGKLLPDYPNRDAAAKVTVQQLLDMRSGIGDFFGPRFADTPKGRIRTIRDYLPLFAADPLLFEPGTDERYSNGGYVVLGAIVEKVSGQDYFTYVRDKILAPAGMTSTDWFEADAPTPNVASGYTRGDDTRLRNNIYTRPARGSSAGGGYSTVGDMASFVAALRGGKLLSAASMQLFFPMLVDLKAGSLGFAGGAPGISAGLEVDVPTDTVVVVLTNLDPPSASQAARRIAGWMRSIRD